MMVDPFAAGGSQLTSREALPLVADGAAGAAGVVAGVTTPEAEDSAPSPTPLVSETLKV